MKRIITMMIVLFQYALVWLEECLKFFCIIKKEGNRVP